MTTLLKILPFIIIGVLIWRMRDQSQRVQRQLRRQSEPLNDWAVTALTRTFSETLGAPHFTIRIIPKMSEVNGLALASGEIYISQGLYDKYRAGEVSQQEMGAVIAHELGHVALGHIKRRMRSWKTETAALAVVWFLLSRIALGWIGLLAMLGLNLMRNHMSHQDEFEADAFAAQLMMRAGMDAHAMVSLLGKLERWGGMGVEPGGVFKWLSTHPPLAERIERAEQVIAAGVSQA